MRIQVYQIIVSNWNNVVKGSAWLYGELSKLEVFTDSDKWEFCIVEVQKHENYVYGYIAQESDEDLIKYRDKKPEEIPGFKWEKTFFIIDQQMASYLSINGDILQKT